MLFTSILMFSYPKAPGVFMATGVTEAYLFSHYKLH